MTELQPPEDFFTTSEHSLQDIPPEKMEAWVVEHVPDLQRQLLDLQERQGSEWILGMSLGEALPDSGQVVGNHVSVAAHAGADGSITVLRAVPPMRGVMDRPVVQVIRLRYADTRADEELVGVSTSVYQLEASGNRVVPLDDDPVDDVQTTIARIARRFDSGSDTERLAMTPDEILDLAEITEVTSGDDPRSRGQVWEFFVRGVLGVLGESVAR